MENERRWIIGLITAGLLGATVFVFLLWHNLQPSASSAPRSSAAAPAPTAGALPQYAGSAGSSFQAISEGVRPAVRPFENLISPEIPLNNGDAPKDPYASFVSQPGNSKHRETFSNPPVYSSLGLTQSDSRFSKVWPDFYIAYLEKMQDAMISAGARTTGERVSFTSGKVIVSFLNDFITFLVAKGVVSPVQEAGLRQGLNVALPETQEVELRAMTKKEQSSLENITQKLLAFLVAPVCAQGVPFIGGDCYKDSNITGPPGINLWAPCCNCCIPTPSGCVPIGCLNAICAFWPNAIWDPATGICGCG